MHIAADIVSARLKWDTGVLVVAPPAGTLSWQLTRGMCPTTATRSRYIKASRDQGFVGEVPMFATSFALFTPDVPDALAAADSDDPTMGLQLTFATAAAGGLVVHDYTGDELMAAIGEYVAIPRGARFWRMPFGSPARFQLVFGYGELVA
jgi:hypothetical protein